MRVCSLKKTPYEKPQTSPAPNLHKTLVSAGGVFELGFFTPGSSKHRFLGIWYKSITPQTVVWVANRQAPVADATGSLAISDNGTLVLTNRSGHVFWSSAPANTSSSNPVARLLDSGNLVLKDASGNGTGVLWQSYDYPSDTLLPGLKLGWDLRTGLDRHLTTWRSPDDPSSGDYVFKIDAHGAPEAFLRRNGTPEYRNGPWNGVQFSGEPEMKPNSYFRFEFVSNQNEVYYMFQVDDSSIISRVVLNQSSVQRYVWLHQGWSLYWSMPRDRCDRYAHCGPYGVCDSIDSPMCGCLAGFTPRSPQDWVLRDNSAGCMRRTPLNCTGDGFLALHGMKLPDTTNATVDSSIGLEQCRQRCLMNCSCLAYAPSGIDGGGSGCIIWDSELIDLRQFAVGGDDLYLRLPASDLATTGDDSRKQKILIAVVVTASVLLLGPGGFCIWSKFFRKKGRFQIRRRHTSFDSSIPLGPVPDSTFRDETSEDLHLTLLDMSTIALSTDNFAPSTKLGEGGFGTVYKGELEGGQTVAVKRLSKYSTQGLDEFKNEVMLIAKLQHVNLVRLLGCCIHGEERILVYEYMENKSLDTFIFDRARSVQLSWSKRFDIILGIARGLLYLHQDSRLRVIHRDLKASNVLLDKDMNPKISDFGVARIFGGDGTNSYTRKVVGTYGYMSPEYAMEGVFSVKSDVFSFGVLVLEVVSGKKNRGSYSSSEQMGLLGYAWKLWREGNAAALLDESIRTHESWQVLRCVQVGLLCVQDRPEDRPDMASVFLMLGNAGAVVPQPKQPGYCSDRSSTDAEGSSTCTVNDVTLTIVEAR